MSDCNACIYTGAEEGDPPEFCNAQVRRAGKSHKCCECDVAIAPGAEYERTTGKWHGQISHYDTCLPCAEIRAAFCCDGWVYGELWKDAIGGDFFKRITTGCLDKLTTAAAKQFLVSKWNEWKFDQG